jgi:hypothetical protein
VKTPIYKTRTFWAMLGLIMTGAAAVLTGEQTPLQAGQIVLAGLGGIFLRDGINKGKTDGSQDPTLPTGGPQ